MKFQKINLKKEQGITLVALIITIIVLIILAAVSISAVYESDLIGYATNGTGNYVEAGNMENDVLQNTISYIDSAIENLREQGAGGSGNSGSTGGSGSSGDNTGGDNEDDSGDGSGGNETDLPDVSTLMGQEATDGNKEAEDVYGNKIVIPEGFKIVGSETDSSIVYDYDTENGTPTVQDGIVVQDEEGNQFVWVPVGEITNNDNTTTIIQLGRYSNFTMGADGTLPTPVQTRANFQTHDSSTVIKSYYYEYAENASYGNTKATDLEKFLTSAEDNQGYYIARYEASYRDGTKPWSKESTGTPITTDGTAPTSNGQLWNNVNQLVAGAASKAMYTNSNYTSDLVNSYAWDTAIVFIQKYSGNTTYATKTSVNTGNPTNTGTTGDIVCNIYDMASNVREWTTETSTNSGYPCAYRGGYYDGTSNYTSGRNYGTTSRSRAYISFRPLLYCSSES